MRIIHIDLCGFCYRVVVMEYREEMSVKYGLKTKLRQCKAKAWVMAGR